MQTKFVMGNRWWDVLFALAMVLFVAIATFTYSPSAGQQVLAWVVLGLMTVAYLLLGRTALRGERFGVLFSAILVVGAGAAVAASPSLAIIQAICFPLIWVCLDPARLAIAFNVLLAASITIGFFISLGTGYDSVVQSLVIEAISLVGSIALGLWISRIADLSAERQKLLDELRDAQGQLAILHRDTGVTSERERLSREIHDTIAQSLTGIVMLAQRATRELDCGDTAAVGQQLGLLEDSARDALVETRALVAASAPIELGGGIASALQRLGTRFGHETGIIVTVNATVSSLDRDDEVVLLRCAQEGLANVRKHSGAQTATVTLVADPDSVVLLVHDDGRGFGTASGAAAGSTGFGLAGLRQRLALAGGDLSVSSGSSNSGRTENSSAGTTLRARLPRRRLPRTLDAAIR